MRDLVYQESSTNWHWRLHQDGTIEMIRRYDAKVLFMNRPAWFWKNRTLRRDAAVQGNSATASASLQFIRSGRIAITKKQGGTSRWHARWDGKMTKGERIMDKVGSFNFITESYLLDFRGQWRSMIGNYMCTPLLAMPPTTDSDSATWRRKNTAWVLSRLAIGWEASRPWISHHRLPHGWKAFTDSSPNAASTWRMQKEIQSVAHVPFGQPLMTGPRRPIYIRGRIWSHMVERPCPIERPGKISPVEELDEGEPYTGSLQRPRHQRPSQWHQITWNICWICSISRCIRQRNQSFWNCLSVNKDDTGWTSCCTRIQRTLPWRYATKAKPLRVPRRQTTKKWYSVWFYK